MKFNLDLNSVKYIKLLYMDSNSSPCTIKAALKQVSDKEMLACRKIENGLDIETPQDITLSIICNDGLYRTKTTLRSVENDEPYTFFILSPPQGLEYQQNREFFRVSVSYNCVYTTRSYYETKELKGETVDISANGVSILFPIHEISVENARVRISINNRLVETAVNFIRSEKVDNGYKFSFAFNKLSKTDQDFISQVCIQKQLEQRRNSIRY